jgi:hypothetical protein
MKQIPKIILHSSSHFLLYGVFIFGAAIIQQFFTTLPSPPSISQPESKKYSQAQPDNRVTPTVAKTSTATMRVKNTQSSTPSSSPKYDVIKESISTEYVYRIFATPNDPGYTSVDWTLSKINAEAAWDITTGNGSTVVAVIDSGFALEHDDLSDRWFTNNTEMGTTQSGDTCWTGAPADKSVNNCDDDANGYVDDWRGWNFVLEDNTPQTGRDNPNGEGVRHGTQVAGLIGAAGNNATGMATLDWNTRIMPLQALDDDGYGYTSDVAAAIYYAADNGADVINLSLGTYSSDPAVKAAVDYAVARNIVVVAAAGNCGDGIGSECLTVPKGKIGYPAAYPDVIAVGAVTESDARASFSSYGPELDVIAPGYAVPLSTSWSPDNPTSLYSTNLYGTSFSSPLVASLSALIKSIRPHTSVDDITALINATTTKPPGMNNLYYTQKFGHGIIDAHAALTIATALNTASDDTPTLLQAGNHRTEHQTGRTFIQSSGCQTVTGNPCSAQFYQPSTGHTRYLPYRIASSDNTSWSWHPSFIDIDSWEIRVRVGENISSTPYILVKKG